MIGIIGAMEDEISLLCESMGKFAVQEIAGYEFFTGKLEGKDIVLLRCGIGKVNAAIGCALLIRQFNPRCVINTGSAGGINPALKVGDAIISAGLIYHDVNVTAFNYAPGQLPHQPQIFPADDYLANLAQSAIDELKSEKILPGSFNYCKGIIGSGDVFVHEPERIAEIRRVFPDIDAVEMEGAAIAHCCYLFSIPALVIRALSDVAGAESAVSFKEFLPVASKHSASIVMRILRQI